MNELLGWYGYCNSTNDDQTIELNNLPNNNSKMTTPDFATILSTTTTTTTTAVEPSTAIVITTTPPTNLTLPSRHMDAINKRNARESSLSLDDTTNTNTTTTTDSMSAIDEMTIMSSPLHIINEPSTAANNLEQSSSPVSHSGLEMKKKIN